MGVEAKVCGLRRGADAAVAVRNGASYLGVIFVTGARREVTRVEAAEVVAAAAGRPVFGVFATEDVGEILRRRDQTGIRGAQLHGTPGREAAARLRREGLLVWRVARLTAPVDAAGLSRLAEEADALLVEPKVEGALGGSGVPLDLSLAREARSALGGRRMVLAGGLRPDTVRHAVAEVHPDIVDVSSGVERRPGEKDPELIRAFLEALVGDHPSP